MGNNILHISKSANNVKHEFCAIFAPDTNHWVTFFLATFYRYFWPKRGRTFTFCRGYSRTFIISISKQHLVESPIDMGETHGETSSTCNFITILASAQDVIELLLHKRQSFWIVHGFSRTIIDIKDASYSSVMSPNFSYNHVKMEAGKNSWDLRQETGAVSPD